MDARLTRLVGVLLLLLGACASQPTSPWSDSDHPLAGRIMRVADGALVSQAALVIDAVYADYVLIGERHDNPEHHRLQADLVEVLQAFDDRPRAVAFERFPAERQLDIVEYLETSSDAAGLGKVVGWESNGRPDWSSYQPIAQAALDANAQIVAAGLDRDEARAVFAEGAAALRSPFVRRTGLGEPWSAPMLLSLQNELRMTDCRQPPPATLAGMVEVQRARDAMMADRLAATAGEGGAVLIAGNNRVRNDRGVPWYLARLSPRSRTVSIGLIEVHDDMVEAPMGLPFDYVWFTPRGATRSDACGEASRDLQRVRQPG
ncbi:MAG: ChaN family lipoprotein [Pseudomonadota bacterium]